MSHLDPEQLALLALGEPVASITDSAHLSSCEICTSELNDLSRTIRIARSTVADEKLDAPPERVWGAIADELALSLPLDAADSDAAPVEAIATQAEPTPAPQPVREELAPAPQPVREEPARRRMGRIWALAASLMVVAGLGLGLGAFTLFLAPSSVAQAVLAPFPDHPDATGTADVEESSSGVRTLLVSVGSDVEPDTYREVWLIRNDAGALISLGVLEGDSGSFAIPDGLDLTEYSLVDVSVEPIDGDPSHSGDSIVRGELSAA
ncbi:anti-sigma factor (plasmid) [Coraliomargarita sp. W4R53]